jgi:hypothetical protein
MATLSLLGFSCYEVLPITENLENKGSQEKE